MARYFVTGATGFLGGELTKQLISRGHQVVALVRTPAKAGVLRTLGVELHQGDITDRDSLRGSMAGVDGVFHCAAWYKLGVPAADAERVNVYGTRHVLETMRELDIPRGVYVSSVAVFSDTLGTVPDETYRFTGRHLSEYDRTKWLAHYEVAEPLIAQGLPLTIAMPGVIYGPGDTSGIRTALVDLLRKRLPLTPRRTTFCWGYIEDTARGLILALERGQPGASYILTGPIHTFEEVFDLAARLAKVRRPLLHPGPRTMRAAAVLASWASRMVDLPPAFQAESLRALAGTTYLGSNAKAVAELGFTVRPVAEGIDQTLEYELRELARLRPPQ